MCHILEQLTLNNGLKIIYEHIPHVRSVALGIWVKSGSRHEAKEYAGMSHFIEHMLFKGTSSRSAKQIADEMDLIGGHLNAYTTKEYTCYYVRTLTSHISMAIDILADMFFNSLFDEKELEKEKAVIIEEINMYEDSPEDLVHDIMEEIIWPDHPLGASISGTAKDVEAITREKMLDYFKLNYVPQNMVISIAGYFDKTRIVDQISSCFGNLQSNPLYTGAITMPIYHPNFMAKNKNIEQAHMCLSFPGVSLEDKNMYAATLLSTAFGGGMSSRLFQKIREEHGLAYSVYSYSSNFLDTGLFTIYAGLNPSQVDEVTRLILAEVDGLLNDPISQTVLYNTKEQLKSNYILGLESTSARMSRNGKNLLLFNKVESQDVIIEELEQVTLEQIKSLVHSIFNLDNMSMVVVGDLTQINVEGLKNHVTNHFEDHTNR